MLAQFHLRKPMKPKSRQKSQGKEEEGAWFRAPYLFLWSCNEKHHLVWLLKTLRSLNSTSRLTPCETLGKSLQLSESQLPLW